MRRLSIMGVVAVVTSVALIPFGSPAQATYQGTNGLIVFGAETKHSGYELFTVRPNGKDLTRITHVGGDAVHPDWSPDASQIVFELDAAEGPVFCAVMLMDADGSNIVDLTTDNNPQGFSGCEGQPSFTPEGSMIVFGRFDDASQTEAIWSMDLSGGNRQQITTGINRGVTDPNVSPNGSTISFIEYSGRDVSQAIATVEPDGSNHGRIVPFRFDVAVKHDWAPNGRRIVFTDNADIIEKPANIATVRPDGSHLRYLTNYRQPDHRAYVGGYSPDGNWIVFRLEIGDRSGLYRMHADGTSKRMILPLSPFRPRFIDWGIEPQ